jgi:hypothetical protein
MEFPMDFAPEPPSPNYYEGLADELEFVAQVVRKNPALNNHLADRLVELAKQLRDDTRLMPLKTSKE